MESPALGIRFALIAVALFAVQDGVSTHLAAHYPVPFFVMIRYWFFAAFVIWLAGRWPGGLRGAFRTRMPVLQTVRGVLLVAQILVIVSAFDLIGLAATQSIFALHPLLTTLIAIPLLGERIGWRRLGAVAAGFVGVLVILRPGAGIMDESALVALAAAVMFAAYGVLTRMANRADGHVRASFFYTGIAGAAAITLIGPFYWVSMAAMDWGWLLLLCLTGMSGHYCLIRALEETEAVRIQPFVYLQMVYAQIVGWLVFREALDGWMLAGMGIIVCAGLYATWREYRLARAQV